MINLNINIARNPFSKLFPSRNPRFLMVLSQGTSFGLSEESPLISNFDNFCALLKNPHAIKVDRQSDEDALQISNNEVKCTLAFADVKQLLSVESMLQDTSMHAFEI